MTETASTPPSHDPLPRLKRIAILLIVLFAMWGYVTYLSPRGSNTQTPTQTPPAAPVATTEPPASLPWQKSAPTEESIAVDSRIAALEARIKTLETAAAEAPITMLNGDPEHLSKLETQVAAQGDALAEMKIVVEDTNRRLAAITVFAQMKEAIVAGRPYLDTFKELASLVQTSEPLQTALIELEPYAESGAPTLSVLQVGFNKAILPALSPSAGTFEKALQSLVRVRKVGEQQGNDDQAIIARAETKLSQGDVVEALKALDSLSPAAADAMAAWKQEATQYLTAREALDVLAAALFSS